MRSKWTLLLLDSTLLSLADVPGGVERSSNISNVESSLMEEWTLPFTLNITTPRSALVGRRLFSFPYPDVSGMCSQATQWIGSAASAVGNALDLSNVVNLFNDAKAWVDKALEVAKAGWNSMVALKNRMMRIFTDFSPLKTLFSDANGLMLLLTNRTSLARLINVVEELLSTSSVLSVLTGALHNVSGMCLQLQNFFQKLLSKVSGGRRLKGTAHVVAHKAVVSTQQDINQYTQLLQGLSFSTIASVLQGFLPKLDSYTEKLAMVQRALGPVLQRLSGALGGQAHSRRLGLESIMKDQQKYADAISAIVPTWQGIEQHGIKLCPHVADTQGGIDTLQCRVVEFARKAALPSWTSSMVSSLVGGCPEPKGTGAQRLECPKTSMSAGISDLLGKNAAPLGLILAIAAALGLLGLGGGAAVAAKRGAGGSSSDSSSGSDSGSAEDGSGGGAALLTGRSGSSTSE